jgi:hypothetical protein
MPEENARTLRRFYDASCVHGAVNATGVAHSIYEHGKAMLEAGWGTDQINADPAIRYIVFGLARLCGLPVDHEQLIKAHSALNGLVSKLEREGHKIPA